MGVMAVHTALAMSESEGTNRHTDWPVKRTLLLYRATTRHGRSVEEREKLPVQGKRVTLLVA